MPEQTVRIEVSQATTRLDQLLAQSISHLSRSQLQKLIRQGNVSVAPGGADAGPVTRPSTTLQPGDLITVRLPDPEPAVLQAEAVPLNVVYEDRELIVLDKPAGMVVHPAHGHTGGTLVNALLARYPELAALAETDASAGDRPGIVHRLDRDTSGLMIVARTPAALRHLRRQFKSRAVDKTYLALVFGQPPAPRGIIDIPLGRDPRFRQRIAPRPDGKPARTHYNLLEELGRYSLLEVNLETGRTHQIRVHLAWLKCPVVGDTVYGRKKNVLGLRRQFLHAWRLKFQHPHSGQALALEAPLPQDLQAVLDGLRIGG